MIVALFNVFVPTPMCSWWDEYSTLLEAQPTLDSEELLYIQEIISENIGRNIRITRDDDSDHNFKLMLDDQALLGLDRSEMHLSSGEQNFISLALHFFLRDIHDKNLLYWMIQYRVSIRYIRIKLSFAL